MARAKRKTKETESPAGEAAVLAPVVEQKETPFEVVPYIPDEVLPAFPVKPGAEVKTVRPFVGKIASGKGRTVSADDTSFAIESTTPLSAGEIALAQRNGFDDMSEKGDGRIMVADKSEVRQAGGDINWVARALTGKDAGRER